MRTIFANSGLCPEAYRGRPNDVLIVWQMGQELGLGKMQSLRTLGCINGIPFAYGDGKLALVRRHPEFEDMKEWFEGDIKSGTLTAFCMIKRKGQEALTRQFSMEDAIIAGLWGKKSKNGAPTPWTLYPRRMLQHRARGFAENDAFPDALFGLKSHEETQSVVDSRTVVYESKTPQGKGMAGLEQSLGIAKNEEVAEAELVEEGDKTDFVPSDGYVPAEHDPIINEFLALVEKNNVPEATRKKWCVRFGLESIECLPIDAMQQIINHYQSKEKV